MDLGGSAVFARKDAYLPRADGLGLGTDLDRSVAHGFSQVFWAMATEKITSHAGWPLFLPRNSQTLAREIYDEVHVLARAHDLEQYCPKKEKQTTPPSRTSADTDASSSAEKEQTQPPSPTSPVDANAPPFAPGRPRAFAGEMA